MRVAVVGTGYVGLVTGTCLAEMGNDVYCVDIDSTKIENLKNGIIPIYEPGLEELVKRNYEAETLNFTTEIKEALDKSDICFIAVGTPMGDDGGAEMKYVFGVAAEIGEYMSHDMIVVDKSTVPVGTADKVSAIIAEKLAARKAGHKFTVVSNPEFLKEGTAIDDTMSPDRVVLGVSTEESAEIMKELYSSFVRNNDRFIVMDVKSAEMTKYAANSMLATRISFMNEISGICEKVGADVNKVRLGVGSDKRIGYSFLYAGCGYGGSCFPKDVRALIKTAEENGCNPELLKSVEDVNNNQKKVIVNKIVKRFGEDLGGLVFGIWGLAFKPNTDDMREAPAISVITELVHRGAKVKVYDPQAQKQAHYYLQEVADSVEYKTSKYSVLKDVDAMVLLTEWKEFRSPDFEEIKLRMKSPIVFDGRNQYNAKKLKELGFEYWQIGVRD